MHNCSVSVALSSQTEPAYSLDRSPSPRSRTLACSHTAICRLKVTTSVVHGLRLICRPRKDGKTKAELTHSGQYSQSEHLSRLLTIDRAQGTKICRPKTVALTAELYTPLIMYFIRFSCVHFLSRLFPSIWNSLPSVVRLCLSVTTLRRHLKPHLFTHQFRAVFEMT